MTNPRLPGFASLSKDVSPKPPYEVGDIIELEEIQTIVLSKHKWHFHDKSRKKDMLYMVLRGTEKITLSHDFHSKTIQFMGKNGFLRCLSCV